MPASSLFGRPRAEVEAALPEREPVTCPLCGHQPRRFATDFQGLALARCGTCGLEFQSPRPVFEQLATAVYGASYHRADEATVDATRAGEFGRQLDTLERLLPRDRRRLLDVGCGAGAFLRFAASRGWHLEGTDVLVTEWARDAGVRLWEGHLPAIDFGASRFDVVRFNHVLEHTVNPLVELQCARRWLSPGGVLLVGVPNLAGLSTQLKSWQSRLRLKSKPWRHYAALHHFWFFAPQTLIRLVEAAGFHTVYWETPVHEHPGRPRWLTAGYRAVLTTVRRGSLLDLYARVALSKP